MNVLSDTTLSLRCKAKEKEVFRIIVEGYRKQAYSFAFSYLKNANDALNISRDVFVRVWKAMDTFRECGRFIPWLFSIIKNLSLNLLERKKNLREISLDKAQKESGFDIADTGQDPLQYDAGSS